MNKKIATFVTPIWRGEGVDMLTRSFFRSHFRVFLVVVMVIAGVAAGMVSGQLTGFTILSSSGRVKAIGVGVYWDINCSEIVSSIDWGMVEPGSQQNVSVYIRNEGNANVTLSLATENWVPVNASDYMTITWDYDGRPLMPGQIIYVTLILSVFSNATGVDSFSFDIIIVGIG